MLKKSFLFENQRVGVFVDVQNIYYSSKNLYSAMVDFSKVLEEAVSNRKLIRAFAYVIKADVGKEKDFFDALTHQGYETRVKDLQVFTGGAKKGDQDVNLVIDAITLAPKIDVVVLVTGDGDFVPLVQYLKNNRGCKVELISFAKTTSSLLLENVDKFTDLGSNPKKYLVKKK